MLYTTEYLLASHLVCVCDKEHAVIRGGHLKCVRLVEDVLCSLDGQAAVHLHTAADEACMDDWQHAVVFTDWHICPCYTRQEEGLYACPALWNLTCHNHYAPHLNDATGY